MKVPLLRGQNVRLYRLDLDNLKFVPPDIHRKWKLRGHERFSVGV